MKPPCYRINKREWRYFILSLPTNSLVMIAYDVMTAAQMRDEHGYAVLSVLDEYNVYYCTPSQPQSVLLEEEFA